MAEKPVIGFIGVGFMGHGMAANILKGGYKLHVKGNRNRVPVDDLVAKGAIEAKSPKAMAEACDIIHICLSNSPQVEAVIRGPEGILASGKKGLIVVDASTADPTSTVALAAELNAAGMPMVDAPLGRTPKEAEEGTLDAMVGADAATYAKVLPVIVMRFSVPLVLTTEKLRPRPPLMLELVTVAEPVRPVAPPKVPK